MAKASHSETSSVPSVLRLPVTNLKREMLDSCSEEAHTAPHVSSQVSKEAGHIGNCNFIVWMRQDASTVALVI